MKTILVIAGEISGDLHAAQLVRALQEKNPDLKIFGIGGDALQACGAELLHHARDMAVFGLPDVLRRFGFFRRVFLEMVEVARARRPDLVLLVDYGGFNLRFAKKLRKLGLKIVYYISPQVWASRRSRIRTMAENVDRLIVIFPFEKQVYAHTPLQVDFVGHPLVDEARAALQEPLKSLPWTGPQRVALLPGSRPLEVERILPVLQQAAARLASEMKELNFLVAAPSQEVAGIVRNVLAGLGPGSVRMEVVVGETRQVLRQARAAWVASGTATLEAALMGCPLVVVYKTNWFTYWAARQIIQVPYIGMVNIMAGKKICPELIQGEATAPNLAAALKLLIADTPERSQMIRNLTDAARALGEGGAVRRAADLVGRELAG